MYRFLRMSRYGILYLIVVEGENTHERYYY